MLLTYKSLSSDKTQNDYETSKMYFCEIRNIPKKDTFSKWQPAYWVVEL